MRIRLVRSSLDSVLIENQSKMIISPLLCLGIQGSIFAYDLRVQWKVVQLLFYFAKNSLFEGTRSSSHGSNNFPAANIDMPSAQSGKMKGT
mmetsp:Transcript_25134/g.41436  ORF Transcript_25134/g.41436 Transcript_25134/m.41436 type:complete len:91 (+) Transcript_25134:133-405(+)